MFKLTPFPLNKVWSFAKTIPLLIAIAMLQLTTHPACLIYFINCRTLSSNLGGRKVFAPQSFLGSSLSSSFSTLASLQFLIIPHTIDSGMPNFLVAGLTPWTTPHFTISALLNLVITTIALFFLLWLWFTHALQLSLNLVFSNLIWSTSLCAFQTQYVQSS